jgi:hypothetical protein
VEGGHEELAADGRAAEALTLELRTRAGVDPDALDPVALPAMVAAGLVRIEHGRAALTRAGRLVASEVTLRLIAV